MPRRLLEQARGVEITFLGGALMGKAICSIPRCTDDAVARTWCMKHYLRWHRHGDPNHQGPSAEERFWSKVKEADALDCWEWTAPPASTGYGQFHVEGRNMGAHVAAWKMLRGEIPEGLQLDHLCRNRICVNPWHLEPVTIAVNVLRGESFAGRSARKTHCDSGHAYTPENTYVTREGWRQCLECKRRASREAYHRRKARLAIPGSSPA